MDSEVLPLCSNVQMRGSDRRDMPGGHSPSSDSTEEREGAFDYSKACFVHTYTIINFYRQHVVEFIIRG